MADSNKFSDKDKKGSEDSSQTKPIFVTSKSSFQSNPFQLKSSRPLFQTQSSEAKSIFGNANSSKSEATTKVFGTSKSESGNVFAKFPQSTFSKASSGFTATSMQTAANTFEQRHKNEPPKYSFLEMMNKQNPEPKESEMLSSQNSGGFLKPFGQKPVAQEISGTNEGVKSRLQMSKRLLTRSDSSQEKKGGTKFIVCRDVPKALNNDMTLRKHFSQFGKIEKINCFVKRKEAHIYFNDQATAILAKHNGMFISSDQPPISIFFGVIKKKVDNADFKTEVMSTFEETREINKPIPAISKTDKPQAKQFNLSDEEQLKTLEAKLIQQANQLNEKMSVLESRDKLMRLRRTKQTDISTAVAVIGTCPDMCPEFERYFREETNQLSTFELAPDRRPDPFSMVKEYRRSGADQEEPLPHELRPGSVLMRSMDYICCNILDRECDNIGEWFDFIWSRTRAIRKDITQQHLCDQTAVMLNEKCARFHIYCAAVLCEEDRVNFDPKINNENLSNCLQSVKDFYYDLSMRNLSCPNEAEFRSYDILLHLNDSEVMLDVKNFQKHVRESTQVKFSIDVYYAFQSRNFSRFFALMRSASFLCACIMHRYVNEMRFHALTTFRKAYTIPNQIENYPMQSIVDQLGFDGYHEVKQFCDCIGLDSNECFLSLVRASTLYDFHSIPVTRSHVLVEDKRSTSIGEAVNGGLLPQNPYKAFPLHNSFDPRGKLKKEAYIADDQKKKTLFLRDELLFRGSSQDQPDSVASRPEVSFQIQQLSTRRTLTELLNETSLQEISLNLINFVTDNFVQKVASDIYGEVTINHCIMILFLSFYPETLNSVIREVCTHVCQEALAVREYKRKKEEVFTKVSSELCESLLGEEINSQVFKISLEECKKEWKIHIDCESSIAFKQLLNSVIRDEVRICSDQVYQEALSERECLIRSVIDKRMTKLSKKYFQKWKTFHALRKRYEYIREIFPAAPSWHNENRIIPNQTNSLSIIEVQQRVADTSKLISNFLERRNVLNSLQFNVIDIVKDCMSKQSEQLYQFWKIVFFVPDIGISKWVSNFFNFEDQVRSSVVSTFNSKSHNVNLCLKGIFGPTHSDEEVSKHLRGTDGVVIFLHSFELNDKFLYKIARQISLKCSLPEIPLLFVVICDKSHSEADIYKFFESTFTNISETFISFSETVSEISITMISDDSSNLEAKLKTGLLWLATRKSYFIENNFETVSFNEFIIDFMENNFFKIATKFGISEQHLSLLFQTYNSILNEAVLVITSSDLKNISYPSLEFESSLEADWNSEARFKKIVTLSTVLKLAESSSYREFIENFFMNYTKVVTSRIRNFLLRNSIQILMNSKDSIAIDLIRLCFNAILESEIFKINFFVGYLKISRETASEHSLQHWKNFTVAFLKRFPNESKRRLAESLNFDSASKKQKQDEDGPFISDSFVAEVNKEQQESMAFTDHLHHLNLSLCSSLPILLPQEQNKSNTSETLPPNRFFETTTEKLDRLKREIETEKKFNSSFKESWEVMENTFEKQ